MLFKLSFVLVHFVGGAQGSGRYAETDPAALTLAFPHHQRDDLAHQRQAAGLVRIEDAPQHWPPRFFVKEIGEALAFVAIDGDLGILHQVRDALLLEYALGQLGKGNGDEGVQLRIELNIFVLALGSDNTAGADVEPQSRERLHVRGGGGEHVCGSHLLLTPRRLFRAAPVR